MEISGFQELRDVSRTLYKTLQDLPTGATSYRNNQQIERKISRLDKQREFFNTKLQLTKLTAAQITNDVSGEADSDEHILEIKNEVVKKNLQERQLKIAIYGKFFTSLLKTINDSPDIVQYRKEIIEQLELSRNINGKIQDCHTKYVRVFSDNIQLKKQLIPKQMDYKLLLNDAQARNELDNENSLDDDYKKALSAMKMRVQKINFMRIVTLRLLSYSKEPLGNDDLCRILDNCRTPYTLESFL